MLSDCQSASLVRKRLFSNNGYCLGSLKLLIVLKFSFGKENQMMFLERLVIGLLGAAMLTAIHGMIVALFANHGWKPMSPSDWGTWVGAIGTVGTLIGALWIAQRDSRTRRHDAKSTAIIHAANMQHRIQDLRGRVENIYRMLSRYSGSLVPDGVIRAVVKDLEALPDFTSDEIAQLVPLGDNCALKLAGVQTALANTAAILRAIPFITTDSPGAPRRTGASWDQTCFPVGVIQRQNARLWEVMDVVQAAVKSAE
jgi:hypothetical protein